jgi:RHS repeat-associated protein
MSRNGERKPREVYGQLRIALWVACLLVAFLVPLFAVSPAGAQEVGPTGSFQTSYPIEVPSYHGLEPDLGLTYNSSAGNGLVGVGWELSGFSYIQRASPGKGAPNYDESDAFFLDGMELIPCKEGMQSPSCQHPASSEYRAYATKAESYRRIAFDPDDSGGWWYVWEKDGTKTTYGPNFKYMESAGGAVKWRVYNWSVRAIEDTVDNNMVEFTYRGPSNPKSGVQELYPAAIEYIGAHTIIRFSYEERPDTITSATGGNEFSTLRYRLKMIDITVGGQRARAYELRYANRDSSTGRSLLSEVQEYGRDAKLTYSPDHWWKTDITEGGTEMLPPVTFDLADPGEKKAGKWTSRSDPTGRWAAEYSGVFSGDKYKIEPPYGEENFYFGRTLDSSQWMPADLNGDGRQDLVLLSALKALPVGIGTAIAQPDGHYDLRTTSHDGRWFPIDGTLDMSSLGSFWFPGDYDGDGKTDIIGVSRYEGKVVLLVAVSNGDGTFHFARHVTSLDWQTFHAINVSVHYQITLPSPIQETLELAGELAGGDDPTSGTLYQGPTQIDLPQRWSVGDVNGDGKADLMLADRRPHLYPPGGPSLSGTTSLCTFVSTGDPSDQKAFVEQPCVDATGWDWDIVNAWLPGVPGWNPHYNDVLRNRFFSGDLDGNGTSDFIRVAKRKDAEYARIDVALSKAGGRSFELHHYLTNQRWQDEDVWFTGDPNGDGRTDLMQVIKHHDDTYTSYDHAALRTYISGQQGTAFRATPEVDTHRLWVLPILESRCAERKPSVWFPGDADGDGRTDFMQAYLRHDNRCHWGGPTDPILFDGSLDLAVARTNQLDATKPDEESCPREEEPCPKKAYDITTTDSQVTGAETAQWNLNHTFNVLPTDANGDGKTDVVFASGKPAVLEPDTEPWGGPWNVSTLLSPNTRRDAYRWQPAELTGDGRSDLVYVEHLNPGIRVHTLLRATDGSLRSNDPITQDILPSQDIPGLDNLDNSHWLPADVNADGRSDLVYVDYSNEPSPGVPGGVRVYTLLSDRNGQWEARYEFHHFLMEDIRRWMPMDVDGDGKVDLVHIGRWRDGPTLDATILFSRGDGTWTKASRYAWSNFVPRDTANWRPMDINGDGKTDLVHVYNPPSGDSSSSTCVHTLLSDFVYDKENDIFRGDWIRRPDPQKFGEVCLNLDIHDTLNWEPGDVNADGKADLVHVGQGSNAYVIDTLLSTGSGNQWKPVRSRAGTGNWSDTPNWKPADVNADGRTDLVHVQALRTLAPSYTQTDTLVSLGDGQWKMPTHPSSETYPWVDNHNWHSADADGNGMDDLVRVDYVEEPGKDPTLRVTSLTSDAPLDLMTSFSNGTGGKTTVGYAPSSRWLAWNAPQEGCHLPAGLVLHHVSSVTTREISSGTSDTVPYDYGCPRWSYVERSFLGYELVGSTHPETPSSPKRLAVAKYKIGDECGAQLAVGQQLAADHSILTRTETYYSSTGSAPYRCLQESSVEYQCDAGTRVVDDSGCAARRTEFSYDEFGNNTQMRECSYEEFNINLGTHECVNTSPNDQERTTLTDYRPATGPYIVGLPSREAVFEGIGYGWKRGKQPMRDTLYCYDGDDGCQEPPNVGLLTKTEQWNDEENRYHNTSYEYDDYGNQTKVIDANLHPTTTQFDETYHLFPERICNALDQCTEQEWDPVIQQVVHSTDANGYSTHFNYDALGRPTQTCYPDGGVRQLSYLDWGDPDRQRVREFAVEEGVAGEGVAPCQAVDQNSLRGIWTETYLDGLGRTYWVVKEGDAPGVTFAQETLYADSSSRAYKQSHWYQRWKPSHEEPKKYEEFHYDEVGRLTEQRQPDGSTLMRRYDEDGTRTSVTSIDELGNKKTTYTDAFGRMVQVREFNRDEPNPDAANYDTFYKYDALDNPTNVTDDKGNVTTMTWDSLGRQLSTDDPDMGHWTYGYDNVGNLTSQTDARGVKTAFTYDALDRLKTKQWNPPNGQVTRWNYDEPGHGASVGRLTSVSDPTGSSCANGLSEQLSYHPMGQVSSHTKCVLGRQYTTRSGYDVLGRQSWVEYPDSESVDYLYDAAGRLRSMPGYVDSFSYDAAGHLKTAVFANNTVERFDYDPDREWLKEATVRRGDETLYQAGYTYKPNGLVASTSSATNKMNMTFNYDGLNRLTEVTGDLQQSFGYDSIGNMTYNSNLGDYTYSNSQPHAVVQAGAQKYTYDDNGNMIGRDGKQMIWNHDNQPEWIEGYNNSWTHSLYDASGARVFEEISGQGPDVNTPVADKAAKGTYYFGPLLEYSSSNGLTKNYYAGSRLIARKDRAGTHFYHQDHLNSTRLITDKNGKVIRRYDYAPFGGAMGQPNPSRGPFSNDIQFGGHRTDEETGLTYMGARYYDPELARFTSADTLVPDLTNPQSLNRYAYVYNNPISYTDPTGHSPEDSEAYDMVAADPIDPSLGVVTQSSGISDSPMPEADRQMPEAGNPTGPIGHDEEGRPIYETIVRAKRLSPDEVETEGVSLDGYFFNKLLIHEFTTPPPGESKPRQELNRWDEAFISAEAERTRIEATLRMAHEMKLEVLKQLTWESDDIIPYSKLAPLEMPKPVEKIPPLMRWLWFGYEVYDAYDDASDWISPAEKYYNTVVHANEKATMLIQAEPERAWRAGQWRRMTEMMHRSPFGLYWWYEETPP